MRKIYCLSLLPFLFSTLLQAAEGDTNIVDYQSNNGLTFSAAIGHLSGVAKEYVYDDEDNSTLSRLDWKTKHAAVLKGGLAFTHPKASWLTIGANGWFTLAEGNATMADYDWMDPDQSNWTDKSYHRDTKLFYANEMDMNATVWLLQKDQYQLGLLAGYKKTVFDWSANGGDYNYENGTNIGSFPNTKVIGYKQRFNTPYIGFSGSYLFSDVELTGKALYSRWVSIHDTDHHVLNDEIFSNRIKNARYYAAEVDMTYHMTKKVDVTMGVTYNHYLTHKKGTTDVYDMDTGLTEHSPSGVSGVKNYYVIASLGLNYTF